MRDGCKRNIFLRKWISRAAILTVCFMLWFGSHSQAQPPLFSQSAKAIIERDFPSANLSYVLLDASGNVLAERWPDEQPVSPGSLVKPFLAIAYGEQHQGNFPTVRCMGTRSRCWLPRGHGQSVLKRRSLNPATHIFWSWLPHWIAHRRRRHSPVMDLPVLPQRPRRKALWVWEAHGKSRHWIWPEPICNSNESSNRPHKEGL